MAAVVSALVTAAALFPSTAVGDTGRPSHREELTGVRVEVRDGLVRNVAPEGSGDVALDAPPSAQEGEVAFVDRDHRSAIVRQVAISGDGSAGFASWNLNDERVAKYDPEGGRVWEHPGFAYGQHGHGLAVDADASIVMAAMSPLDIPALGLAQLVTWRDGAGPGPTDSRLQPIDGTVLAAASADGSVAVASHEPRPGAGLVGGFVLAVYGPGPETAPEWITTGAGLGMLQGVDISGDGSTVAVSTNGSIFVYRPPEAAPVAVIPNDSQTEAHLSGDGTYLALGGRSSEAHLYAWDGTTYEKRWSRNVGHPWVSSVAVANDGTVVAGTWSYTDGNAGKVLALAPQDGTTLWECLCYGDYVDDVDVTPDGSRAVAVSWGDADSTNPAGDVFTAFDAATGEVLFRLRSGVDEPGSLHSTAISDDGTRVLAGGKAVHARAFGNGGQVYGILLCPESEAVEGSTCPRPLTR